VALALLLTLLQGGRRAEQQVMPNDHHVVLLTPPFSSFPSWMTSSSTNLMVVLPCWLTVEHQGQVTGKATLAAIAASAVRLSGLY
jgi:hypothetical protein